MTVEHPHAPPSAERVARRALTLAAVVCRSTIEDDAGDTGSAEAEALRESVLAWVEEIGITSEVEPDELALLQAPIGSLAARPRVDGTWRSERLVVLGWALGRCELPAYDYQCEPFTIAQALGFRHPRDKTVLADARLRAPEELTALAETLRSQVQRMAEGDLEVRGTTPSQIAEPVLAAVTRIIRERQQAAQWLLGASAT